MTAVENVLVVADDFGSWPLKTNAIFEAFDAGLITASSAMATFPDFERAGALAVESEHADALGVHLVLTDGVPLTDAMRRWPAFCDSDGLFHGRPASHHLIWLSPHGRRIVADEMRAQIVRLRSVGLRLAHLDSHHHIHTAFSLTPIAIALAREFRIGRVRLAPNVGIGRKTRRPWIARQHASVRRAGLSEIEHTASLRGLTRTGAATLDGARLELFVHPVLHNGRLEDEAIPGLPLAEAIGKALR
jgi:predicted glycoside hydrolase/deacetylase ChbG (UPF0249 family)